MNLEDIILKCQGWLATTKDNTIIQMLTSFEEYVDQAYQGRLLYELIQNARDAAHMDGSQSDIYIEVSDDRVIFANTGKGFDEGGVWAMSRLGISKKDKDLIGKKGIGFKAIQQFTRTPRIATAYGTMLFDRTKLQRLLTEMFPEEFDEDSNVPLFLYPHYEATTSEDYIFGGRTYDTVVAFEPNNERPSSEIAAMFKMISYDHLVLLGNIRSIIFKYGDASEDIYINEEYEAVKTITGTRGAASFKIFKPEEKIEIPDTIVEQLDLKQKKLYLEDRELDMKIVFHIDGQGIPLARDSKLFLYYPLEMHSGFNYIIHADFNVNPERTKLLSTPLNSFLFQKIVSFQMEHVLPYLKTIFGDNRIIDFLEYKPHDQRPMELLKLYKEHLVEQEFIWVEREGRYLAPSRIMLCSSEEYGLFSDYLFDGHHLVALAATHDSFLSIQLNVSRLLLEVLLEKIEAICEAKKNDPYFFGKLYKYFVDRKIDVRGRKILLGSSGQLFVDTEDIFHQAKNAVKVPESISDKLLLLHDEILISTEDAQNCYNLTGIREYRVLDLVHKALALMRDNESDRYEILRFFKELPEISEAVHSAFREKMLLPVMQSGGAVRWLNPISVPIYIEKVELRSLYPNGYYVVLGQCCPEQENLSDWISFLVEYAGAWDRPAMFVKENRITDTQHIEWLHSQTKKGLGAYTIYNDRVLDFPTNPDRIFFNMILRNWKDYYKKSSEFPSRFTFSCDGYDNKWTIEKNFLASTFLYQLTSERWIFTSDNAMPFTSDEIFGIDRADFNVERLLVKYTSLLPLDYNEASHFFDNLGMLHFNSDSGNTIVRILDRINKSFADLDGNVIAPDFKKFYHVVLKYLYKIYASSDALGQEKLLAGLRRIKLLAVLKTSGIEKAYWREPSEIYYLDDKTLYDQLPDDARSRLGSVYSKTDRNEIGKLFIRIGKPLSQEVKSSIHSSGVGEDSEPLFKAVTNVAFMLQAVENKLERQFEQDEIKKIQEIVLQVSREIYKEVVLVSVEGYMKRIELGFNYQRSNKRVLIRTSVAPIYASVSIQGEVMESILSSITGRDLGVSRLLRDLAHGKSTVQFKDGFKDGHINEERVQELEELLFEDRKSAKQEFWNGVLLAKGMGIQEIDSRNEDVEKEKLSRLLNAPIATVEKWIDGIDYGQLDSGNNITILKELLDFEQIDLKTLAGFLGREIDFGTYFQRQVESYKNRIKDKAITILYSFFQGQEIAEKKKFNGIVEDLNGISFKGSIKELDVSAEGLFLDLLIDKFPYASFTQDSLEVADPSLWILVRVDFPKRNAKVSEKLVAAGLNGMHIVNFLAMDSTVSLLYFEAYEELLMDYRRRYGEGHRVTAIQHSTTDSKQRYDDAEDDDFPILEVSLNDSAEAGENPLDQVSEAISSGPRGWGGGSGWGGGLPSPSYLKRIGAQGEFLLFKKLKKNFGEGNVHWVSENAADYGECKFRLY